MPELAVPLTTKPYPAAPIASARSVHLIPRVLK
jgi:hypothetical protein